MGYPFIEIALRTIFNAKDGLCLAVSCGLYARSIRSSPAFRDLKEELARALADQDLSWKELLSNDMYEVIELDTEEDGGRQDVCPSHLGRVARVRCLVEAKRRIGSPSCAKQCIQAGTA
ncbi:hypothetical protein FHY19_004324 [Xanthomonas arboricola]|nr:hypothetical protein [Xanthomonas sp. 4461]